MKNVEMKAEGKLLKSFLQEYNFQKYADIVSNANGNHAFFDNRQDNCSGCGYVYLWIEEDGRDVKVVYVGKAGKTMKNRCNEHLGGFKRSSTGRKHLARILSGISKGKKYCVYAKKSSCRTIFGEQGISMGCVEELALTNKLNPPWNFKRGSEA